MNSSNQYFCNHVAINENLHLVKSSYYIEVYIIHQNFTVSRLTVASRAHNITVSTNMDD